MQIWDSCGQEKYRALIPSYIRGSSIVLIVYDVSDKNTFINVTTWINFVKQVNTDESLLVLCGNKIDLPRQVSTNEAKNLAEKEKILFFEFSAKSGDGIDKMMYTCISKLPFFEQYKIDNNDILINELSRTNGGGNNNKIINNNIEKPYKISISENSSNVILTKKNNNKEKKKCNCWQNFLL